MRFDIGTSSRCTILLFHAVESCVFIFFCFVRLMLLFSILLQWNDYTNINFAARVCMVNSRVSVIVHPIAACLSAQHPSCNTSPHSHTSYQTITSHPLLHISPLPTHIHIHTHTHTHTHTYTYQTATFSMSYNISLSF